MRIAFVLYDFDLGGMPGWTFSLATRLHGSHELFFVSTRVPEISPRFRSLGGTLHAGSARALVTVLRRIRPDVVQFGQDRLFGDCAMAAGVAVVVERVDGRRQRSLTQSKRDLDAVIASTQGTVPILERLAPGRVHLIYNGIDATRFGAAPRERLGLPDSAVIVGAVSRFGRGKNLELLVDAVRRLAPKYPQMRLVLVGGNSRMPGAEDYEAVLRRHAEGLGDRVVFAGRVAQPERLVAGFDIGALVSRPGTEGIPNAVLEMMASGKPVVATDVDDLGEVVEPERTGLLVGDGKVDDLVAALDRLARDADLRQRLGEAGRARVARDFDLSPQVEKYRQLYARLVDDAAERRHVSGRAPRMLRAALALGLHAARAARSGLRTRAIPSQPR